MGVLAIVVDLEGSEGPVARAQLHETGKGEYAVVGAEVPLTLLVTRLSEVHYRAYVHDGYSASGEQSEEVDGLCRDSSFSLGEIGGRRGQFQTVPEIDSSDPDRLEHVFIPRPHACGSFRFQAGPKSKKQVHGDIYERKGTPVKRRYMMLGLAVVLMLVLLVALAGAANAKAEKKTEFQALVAMMPYGTFDQPEVWQWTKMWDGPDGLWHIRDRLWVGYNFLPVPTLDDPDAEGLPFLTGYCENLINLNGRFGGDVFFEWANTFEKATLYIGVESRDDVDEDTSVWELSTVGKMEADGSETITGVGHGVAGDVMGWVMHFTARIDFGTGENLITGYCVQK
jgi:hypothetical protein